MRGHGTQCKQNGMCQKVCFGILCIHSIKIHLASYVHYGTLRRLLKRKCVN